MTEYTIDDIRGPTVAREMAQLKEFVLAQFNGAIADAEAAAAAAATAAANAVLANTVKKTGEASQTIAGDVAITGDVTVTGSLDAASIGSGSTPVVCGNLTAYGSVSLDDTTLQGNLASADSSALINLSGAGSVLVPTPTSNSEAATKKYVDDALDNYTPMVRTTGNQNISGIKTFTGRPLKVYVVGSGGETDVSLHIADNRTDASHTIGTQTGQFTLGKIGFFDGNGNWGATIFVQITTDGKGQLITYLRNADGTRKSITLASGD